MFSPLGGMTISTVLERNESGLSTVLRPPKASTQNGFDTTILEEDSPIRTQMANRAAFDFEPYHEAENNEDQKTPGYPDGPIAIYGDNVYLYLEPNAEVASRFDVVINVAREVRNPFEGSADVSKHDQLDAGHSPIPDTAATTASFSTAFEVLPDEPAGGISTTLKAQASRDPEYIHIPWDHNTDIGPDLMMLCETIESKTKEGKKVLVHCQQGASRSASLIIAYGMYQNPDLSVNDAYYAAQAKSKWISPNMRLMYCLQDFQKEIATRKLSLGCNVRSRPGKSPTKHRATLSADNISVPTREPLTAPLPDDQGSTKNGSPERSPKRNRADSTPNRADPVSPGFSSAPSSCLSWPDQDGNEPRHFTLSPARESSLQPPVSASGSSRLFFRPPPSPRFAALSPGFAPPPGSFSTLSSPGFSSSHRLGWSPDNAGFLPLSLAAPPRRLKSSAGTPERPERQITTTLRSLPDDTALMSPRVETMTRNPLHDTSSVGTFAGMTFVEVPPTPNDQLFSPRETMFPRDPFFSFGRPSQMADPRSPPTKGEAPIVRSIDELI